MRRRTSTPSKGRAARTTINGPGNVYGGINASGAATTISKTTLELEPRGTTRFDPVKLLDLGAQKSIRFKGGRSFKVMVDAFNIFNINTDHVVLEREPRAWAPSRSPRRSSPRGCSASAAGSLSKANLPSEEGIRASGPGPLCYLFAACQVFQFSGSGPSIVFLIPLRPVCSIPQPVTALRVPSVFGMATMVGGGGQMNTRGFRAFLLAAGLLAAWVAPAHAQAIGSIFGKVTDSSGGVLPGVTVTVAGPALQQPLVAVTGATGTYQFPSVPIGTYTVTFELNGFKKAVASERHHHHRLQRAASTRSWKSAPMTEEVTVTAASPVVDTKKTTTGATFTQGHPREDPDGARPVADHQHDAGRAGRPERRRLGVRPAGRARGRAARRRTCSGTSKAARSPTCRRTRRRRTSTSTRSSRSRSSPAAATSRCSPRVSRSTWSPRAAATCSRARRSCTFENDAMQAEQRHAGAVQRGRATASSRATRSRRSRTTRSSTAVRS